MHKYLNIKEVNKATESIKAVTSESAFLIRTIFFTMFGYMINTHSIFDTRVLLVGTIIVLIIFLVRYFYLRIFVKDHILPELFFAPRGLVTVVLFYSIPSQMVFNNFDDGVLFYVIVLSTTAMMMGSTLFTPKNQTRKTEEASYKGSRGVFSKYFHE